MEMENRKWRASADYSATPAKRLMSDWNPRGQAEFYKMNLPESGHWTIWYNHKQETERRTIVLDGNNFSNLEEFYLEVDRLFRNNTSRDIRHNLSTLNDLLRGGSKTMKFEEPIKLVWKNSTKSAKDLGLKSGNMWAVGESFFAIIAGIISEHKHIRLSFE